MTKFKIGDKVRATYNGYGCTTLENEWEGVFTEVHINGEFDAKTTKSKDEQDFKNSVVYEGLETKHFEIVSEKPTKNQRITALEQMVFELQTEVAALKSAQDTPRVFPVTADNVGIGDKIRVVYASGIGPAFLTNGKVYEVESRDTYGNLYVTDDEGGLMSIVESEFHAVEKVVV